MAGSDTINLNNPTALTGLTGITVNGNDPTGSDTLVYSGRTGTADYRSVDYTGTGSGTITGTLGVTPVTFNGTEQLTMVGQTADGDRIHQFQTAGDDTFEFTPGATPDAGAVTGFVRGALNFNFVPVQFSGFGSTFNSINDSVGASVGNDTVIVNGTNADDTISFGPPVIGAAPTVIVNGGTPILLQDGLNTVVLRGLDGNDTFNVSLATVGGDPNIAVRIEGGNSDASTDTLNYTATIGAATTIDLGCVTITQTAPVGNRHVQRHRADQRNLKRRRLDLVDPRYRRSRQLHLHADRRGRHRHRRRADRQLRGRRQRIHAR